MTTNRIQPVVIYVEDGQTTLYPIPFKFLSVDDLIVDRINLTTKGRVILAADVDFVASGANQDGGGQVRLLSLSTGTRLRIRRRTTRVQGVRYIANDRFPAASHEGALDRQMLIAQEQDVEFDEFAARALLLPVGVESGALVPLVSEQGVVTITPTGEVAVLPSSALVGGSFGNFDGGFDGMPDGDDFDGGVDG